MTMTHADMTTAKNGSVVRLPVVKRPRPEPVSRLASFPGFPNGWFFVCLSSDLPVGVVKPIVLCGHELVVFRGHDGASRLVAAYCAHLGTHMGHGSRVVGDTLECPFHGWRYDGEGRCVHIPYADKIPVKACVETWPVREANGMIMAYHHAEGDAPDWDVPLLPEHGSAEWSSFAVGPRGNIRTHAQELMENGVDTAHLGFLHRRRVSAFRTTSLEVDGRRIIHRGAQTFTHPVLDQLGLSLPPHRLTLRLYGLGLLVSELHVGWAGIDLLTVLAFRPIDGEYTEVVAATSIKRWRSAKISTLVRDRLMREVGAAFAEDVMILEHKIMRERPVLCQGDGPIMRFRGWAQQFYSKPRDARVERPV
jgi:nitrite reductase/ring-hydroxylating ferredoxin subunit